jgi:hypothetical protein
MSFEITTERPKAKEPRRIAEAREMFEQLSKDPEKLTAKIDMASVNIRRYARNLGYKIKATKIDDKNCYVWIVK